MSQKRCKMVRRRLHELMKVRKISIEPETRPNGQVVIEKKWIYRKMKRVA